MGRKRKAVPRQKRPKKHQPHPDIVTIYLNLVQYRKADVSGMAAPEIADAMLKKWPELRNLNLEPTFTWRKAVGIACLGIVLGVIVVLAIMSI